MGMWAWTELDEQGRYLMAIALGTLASEDLTLIATGLAVRTGSVPWELGVAACAGGIYIGDMALFLIGRTLGRRVLSWGFVRARASQQRLSWLAKWFDERPIAASFTSRFTPGLRLPGFLAAGALGTRPWAFAWWTLVATLVWTPLLVLIVAAVGHAVVTPLRIWLGGGWAVTVVFVLAMWLLLRLAKSMRAPESRSALMVDASRLWRWEFWPSWVFYAPLMPWIGWLALRHGGLRTAACANPSIPHGGLVGESKDQILRQITGPGVLAHTLVEPGDVIDRMRLLADGMSERGVVFPVVLKPDAGQRGAAVRVIRSWEQARDYLLSHPQPTIAQVWHPGPCEAGIFYHRMPGQERGRIFSITDKVFPQAIGDGRSTLSELIALDPRLRMQSDRFMERLSGKAMRVPAAGEKVPLAQSGNHCQGTLFQDGWHLWSPELEAAIDQIARRSEGFFFGRFDVRYREASELMRGEGFGVVELNGLTSESTDIYDPRGTLAGAYRKLAAQWSLAFEIGAANRCRGVVPTGWGQVWRDARKFYQERSSDTLSD